MKPKSCPARTSSNLPVPASLVRDNPDIVKMLSRQLTSTLIVPAYVPRGTMEAAATELVAEIDPRDAIEGMMATQMVAAHNMTMDCFRRVAAVESVMDAQGAEINLRLGAKMSATFVKLSDALERRRGRGPARVSVENVNVGSGGQAIVGNVETPPVASRRKRGSGAAARVRNPVPAERLDWGPDKPEFQDERIKRTPGK